MRCMMHLTDDGKTLVWVVPSPNSHLPALDEMASTFQRMMGKPQAQAVADSGEFVMLFPHRNLPDEVREIAEQITSLHLVRRLEAACPAAFLPHFRPAASF